MKKIDMLAGFAKLAIVAVLSFGIGGCSMTSLSSSNSSEVFYDSASTTPSDTPGVVEFVWEEPMIDVVDVPPGLDPEGVYYRPAHKEIVEIRQGRWKYVGPPK